MLPVVDIILERSWYISVTRLAVDGAGTIAIEGD